jgi:alpha-glucosidase
MTRTSQPAAQLRHGGPRDGGAGSRSASCWLLSPGRCSSTKAKNSDSPTASCRPDATLTRLPAQEGRAEPGAAPPMPWEPAPALGFTSAARAWLPSGERADHETAAVQAVDPASPLSATRRLIAARRPLGIEPEEPADWLETELLVAYRRGDVLAAANLGDAPGALDPGPGKWQVVFDTDNLPSGESGKARLTLRPKQAVLAVRRPSSPEGAHRA